MSDDTDQQHRPDREQRPAEMDHPTDRSGDPDPDDQLLAPTHPTDAELAQREQDRELESGEENPG